MRAENRVAVVESGDPQVVGPAGGGQQPVPTPEPMEATVRTLRPEPTDGTDAVVLDGEDRLDAGRRHDDSGRDGTHG